MNEKMERLLTILQDVNYEIDFAHERHMVDDGLIDSLELMKRTSTARRRFWRW